MSSASRSQICTNNGSNDMDFSRVHSSNPRTSGCPIFFQNIHGLEMAEEDVA